ncbi:hypothetical protein AB0E08_48895 [Streptomyces sp. NPDC048281]|uniref:hypothetical protein n=1 Tax=Streptomyces sp. NPDC048281 TaxID=3154715 RepID=UPI00343216BF
MSYGMSWEPRFGYIQDDVKPHLTVAAALHVPSLMTVMAQPFFNVLRTLVEFHRAMPLEPDKVVQAVYMPKMIRRELPSISDQFMARLPEILNHEPPTWGGSKGLIDGEWTRELGRDISRYSGLNDVQSYVIRVAELMPEPVTVGAEPMQTGPRLRLPQPVIVRQLPTSVMGLNSEPEESPASEPEPSTPVYVDELLIKELETNGATSQWDVTKLVQLLRELNSNFAAENAYSCLALLRATLDHIPPVLNASDFDQAASNFKWGKSNKSTDRAYALKLKDARALGDDVLHRQIGKNPDLLDMEDVPHRRYLNRVLRHVIDAL